MTIAPLKRIFAALLTTLALSTVAPAAALASTVELTSRVFVEKQITQDDGTVRVTHVPADKVVPGDKLVFIIAYTNKGSQNAADFVITNPLPADVRYVSAAGAIAPTLSVDKGATFGKLAELKVQTETGVRPAAPGDVTHVRWKFADSIPGGATGEVSFNAILK